MASLRRLKPLLSWRFATLWLIVGVNVVLIALYLWSRGGATTDVRIEVAGSSYRAFVDGQLIAEASFPGRIEGGVGFRLARDDLIPSLPKPSGIDSVRVTDPATGEVIFEDTFGGSPSDLWVIESGDWRVDGGVFSTSTDGIVTTGRQPWGDYVLEANLRNVPRATIFVRAEDSRNAVGLWIRPFRHYDSSLGLYEAGQRVEQERGAGLHLDRGQTTRSIAATLLRSYPTALLMAVGAVVVAFAVWPAWRGDWLQTKGRFVPWQAILLMFGVALAMLLPLWYLSHALGSARLHVPGPVEYVFERPYAAGLLMMLCAIIIAVTVRALEFEDWLQRAGRSVLQGATYLVVGLALAALVLLWYLNYVVGEAMPHVPDSVLYVFQGKIFASFRLVADAPPVRESFSIFHPHMLQLVDDRWFSHYPFGHPLALAIGLRVGAVWLVPPIIGAVSAYLIYRVGHHVYGTAAGLLAAVLLFFSPFFQMTASNFMSHSTGAFYLLASLFFLARPTERRALSMFLSGVFLGLFFNTRPLPAVAFMPVLGVFMAYEFLCAGPQRWSRFRDYLAFAAGGLLLLLAYFLYNHATTGSFTQSPYALQGTQSPDTFGFGGAHSVAVGLQNQQELLAFLMLVVNGWPAAIGLSLAILPFVLGTRSRWDYLFAASAIVMAAATIFYKNAAVMHGPRFWYEAMPFLILLTARGAQRLIQVGSVAGDWLAGRFRITPSTGTPAVTSLAVYSLVGALVVFSAYGWMLGKRDAWSGIDYVPEKISALEGFNGIDRRLLDTADEMDLHNALVLVRWCANWHCLGSVFWTNSPDLDSDVVWAEQQKDERVTDNLSLLQAFSGRNLYLADYRTGTIEPVTEEDIVGDAAEAAARVTPVAPELPPPGDRDVIRRQDLKVIQSALEQYAEQTGAYPTTKGQVQTLCVYRTLDAGCALQTILPTLPTDPLGSPGSNGYWYTSDGASYVLIAKQEEMEVEDSQCPENLSHLGQAESLYCLRGPAQ